MTELLVCDIGGIVTSSGGSVELRHDGRGVVQQRARRRKTARGGPTRAEIVLLAATGASNVEIAAHLGVTRATATTWHNRFAAQRLDGLLDG